MFVCMYVMCTTCIPGTKETKGGSLEQKLQTVESCHMSAGTELGSSVRAASLQPQHEVSFM